MAQYGEAAEKYLTYAEELRAIAADMKNGRYREMMLKIAVDYERMAERLQKIEASERPANKI